MTYDYLPVGWQPTLENPEKLLHPIFETPNDDLANCQQKPDALTSVSFAGLPQWVSIDGFNIPVFFLPSSGCFIFP